jgi:hypothetical protein
VHNWPVHRLLLSRGGNIYIRMALACRSGRHGGYRAYRMPVLDAIDVATVASTGYSFQVELAWRHVPHGFRMTEVPITVHRARTRRQQDERQHLQGTAAQGHVWGACGAPRRSCWPSWDASPRWVRLALTGHRRVMLAEVVV